MSCRLPHSETPQHSLGAARASLVSHLGASINGGPQKRPKYILVLDIGATKMGPLIFGNSHLGPIGGECFGFGAFMSRGLGLIVPEILRYSANKGLSRIC